MIVKGLITTLTLLLSSISLASVGVMAPINSMQKASVALIPSSSMTRSIYNPAMFEIKQKSSKQLFCSKKMNVLQLPTTASCSGVLISENHILTSKHCLLGSSKEKQSVSPSKACSSMKIVFDYNSKLMISTLGGLPLKLNDYKFPEKQVYNCKRVVASSKSYRAGKISSVDSLDFAILEISGAKDSSIQSGAHRPIVLDWAHYTHRQNEETGEGQGLKGERLGHIGHPFGLPQRYVEGAALGNQSDSTKHQIQTLYSDMITYKGSSGGVVFTVPRFLLTSKHTPVGIISRGDPRTGKLTPHPVKSCLIGTRCSNLKTPCAAEEITLFSEIMRVHPGTIKYFKFR